MPTSAEIAAAASALTVSIQSDRGALDAMQDAAKRAQDLDDTATAIETAGHFYIGLKGENVKVGAAGFVGSAVTGLRARAEAIRDGIVLPVIDPPAP